MKTATAYWAQNLIHKTLNGKPLMTLEQQRSLAPWHFMEDLMREAEEFALLWNSTVAAKSPQKALQVLRMAQGRMGLILLFGAHKWVVETDHMSIRVRGGDATQPQMDSWEACYLTTQETWCGDFVWVGRTGQPTTPSLFFRQELIPSLQKAARVQSQDEAPLEIPNTSSNVGSALSLEDRIG